jgi:hypothetical protein
MHCGFCLFLHIIMNFIVMSFTLGHDVKHVYDIYEILQ